VSVDYLIDPVAVFAEVGRVLKPGGLFLVIFSNRWFEPKVTNIWRRATEPERVFLVERWFKEAGVFSTTRTHVSREQPRPSDDRYASFGIPSDPIYAVFADRTGGSRKVPRRLPSEAAADHTSKLAQRKAFIKETLCCPHCDEPLQKWIVPQTPFTEWPNEYFLMCFNDHCPYFARGWQHMADQGNVGWSCRFMYDDLTDTIHAVPVQSRNALKANIVESNEIQDQHS
jgi:SAM-dependent methyltransferase